MANDYRNRNRDSIDTGGRRFIGLPGLAKRWDFTEMGIEKKLRKDSAFQEMVPVYRFGRTRKFDLADIENYEKACVKRTA